MTSPREMFWLLAWPALLPIAGRYISYWYWLGMPMPLVTFIGSGYVLATLAVWMRLFTWLRITRNVALEDCKLQHLSSLLLACSAAIARYPSSDFVARYEKTRHANFLDRGLFCGLGKWKVQQKLNPLLRSYRHDVADVQRRLRMAQLMYTGSLLPMVLWDLSIAVRSTYWTPRFYQLNEFLTVCPFLVASASLFLAHSTFCARRLRGSRLLILARICGALFPPHKQ